jgi:uncharacterized LabA/DUF88 family protein
MKDKTSLYVFIDASNIWEAQKTKAKFVSWEKIRTYLTKQYSTDCISFFYYTAYPKEGTREYKLDGRHKFYTYLKKGLGFNVIKKPLKRIVIKKEEGEVIEEKGDMDVELTIDAIHNMKNYSIAIFFSGDSDFLALVRYLRNLEKKVYIYSSTNNISTELRTGADGYKDILKIEDDIWGKDLKYRESLNK